MKTFLGRCLLSFLLLHTCDSFSLRRSGRCPKLGDLICSHGSVSALQHWAGSGSDIVQERRLRFGDECAIETQVKCKARNASSTEQCSSCGECPCQYDPSAGLHAKYMKTMFEELKPLCSSASETRVLTIGLGGGELPQFLLHSCPSMRLETVELNADVIYMARQYFGLGLSEAEFGQRLTVEQTDGLAAVKERVASMEGQFDAVLVDCFAGQGEVPADCRSRVFADGIKTLLKTNGMLLQNIWDNSKVKGAVIAHEFAATRNTYGEVFGRSALEDLKVPMPPQIQWVHILKATKADVPME